MAHSPIQEHIDLIAKHEQEFLSRRTWDERVGDSVSGLVGSLTFVGVHVVLLLLWITTNTGLTFQMKPFDPPPFPVLDLLFSFESILLASFILMRQSRIARRSQERNHLELQLMLLTEKELTATLGICREIAAKVGLKAIAGDREIDQLAQEISVDQMAETIREKLSE
ncbi:MAG: DUF1003 domain-containing protein [Acidobacteria bacterium]|nr:DUF1003 domain-containing protein [Acidobacteriota bacterium]